LAQETSRIRLGTLLTSATFRLPGPLAISVAQVDQMSGGRVELGLGAGWFDREHRAYGIPFGTWGERFEKLEEQLAIITGLWRTPTGERFAYDGKHYQLSESPALPKSTQDPHPPVIVGGHGPNKTPRLAAAFADEFNLPFPGSVESVAQQFDRVRGACRESGRDPETMRLSAALLVCCGRDDAEVKKRAAAIGRDDVDQIRGVQATGTVNEVVDTIGRYAEIGATAVYLQLLDLSDLDQLELVAQDVMAQISG
jgi:F420-dependent oxidoreductase-like protein